MTVKLTRRTTVWHEAGEVLELPEAEAKRLITFNMAKPEEKKTAKKSTKK